MNNRINKRILFTISSMAGGGAERVAALLCNYWVGTGHEVTIMSTFQARVECIYQLDQRVKLEYLADRMGSTRKSLLNKLNRLIALRQAIKEYKPDVIISFFPQVNIAAIIASLGLKIPVVVSERIYPPAIPLSIFMNYLRRLTYPIAKTVVVQTEQGHDWLKTCCPGAKGSIAANPVVYPLPESKPKISTENVLPNSKYMLLGIGRLDRQKGFDILIDAFASLANQYRNWDLVILGEGCERQNLERQRKLLDLTNRVHLPGRAGNMADWYKRAQIYIMSSRFEGFPNTLLEAMAYGLPVISFDCDTGPRDIIDHDENGILVNPRAGSYALGDAILSLIQDKAKREYIAKNAVLVRERYSLKNIAKLWDKVLSINLLV